MLSLHENIRELRIGSGLNQVELGKILNVSKQCISNWENDNVVPSIDMLVKLADCFQVTTDWLLGRCSDEIIQVDGLLPEQVTHIRLLIQDFKTANAK